MAIKFDKNCVYNNFGNKGNNDLLLLLDFLQQEPSINTIIEASYTLATFAIESAYRGNTYESYFLNSGQYDSPKNASERYINWASKKNNYKGPRYSNGVPMYVGRGFIQITHDYNYRKYSSVVPGLFEIPELAMNANNAWLIAMKYFSERKTLEHATNGDLTKARRSVNGGTNHLSEVNNTFNKWVNVFKNCRCQENQPGNPILASNIIRGGPGSNSSSSADLSNISTTNTTPDIGYVNGAGSTQGTNYADFFANLNQNLSANTEPNENTNDNITNNENTNDNSINSSSQATNESLSQLNNSTVKNIKENNTNTCG